MKPRLVLSADAFERRGGQGLNFHHMIEGLRDDFDLLAFCRAADNIRCIRVPALALVQAAERVPLVRRARDWLGYLSQAHFDRYVARHLSKADIFQGTTGQCANSLRAARAVGCRVALDVVTTHIDDFRSRQLTEGKKLGVRPATSRLARAHILREYADADLIRVSSKHALTTFLERGFSPQRFAVAPPFLDVSEFPRATFSNPVFRIIYVGLVEPWKGFHYLIDAYLRLALRNSELVIWGGPGSRAVSRYLGQAMARNPSIKLEPKSVRDVGYDNVYGQASVLVHPSLSDGFGYVVAEAMASGLPVIATHATGAAELIREGETGFIVAPADAEALAQRIEHLARNTPMLPAMGAKARQTVSTMLTRDLFRRNWGERLKRLAA